MRVFLIFFTLIVSLNSQSLAFTEEKCTLLKEKYCADYSQKIIQGVATSQCWKYEQRFKCIGKEQNHCSIFEENRGCRELTASCNNQSDLSYCLDMQKTFVCGAKLEERPETRLINTDYHVKRDELDLSGCSQAEVDKLCERIEEKCIEGPQTRNINGKEVFKSCWKWDYQYLCRTGSLVSECKDLPEICQKLPNPECLHERKGECDHYQYFVSCNGEEVRKKQCLAASLCVGGVCDSTERKQHNDFGKAMSGLSILAAMKSNELDGCKCPDGKKTCERGEIDPNSCKFFTGNSKKCSKTTGEHNCCSEKGFVREIYKCSAEEKELVTLRKAKLCHFVGTKKKGKIVKTSNQVYCCYRSILARIIQEAGHNQLNLGWGSADNPQCQALTLEQIRRVDFSKIDYSDLITDIKLKAENFAQGATTKIQAQAKTHEQKIKTDIRKEALNQAKEGRTEQDPHVGDLWQKKMKNFYKDVK